METEINQKLEDFNNYITKIMNTIDLVIKLDLFIDVETIENKLNEIKNIKNNITNSINYQKLIFPLTGKISDLQVKLQKLHSNLIDSIYEMNFEK